MRHSSPWRPTKQPFLWSLGVLLAPGLLVSACGVGIDAAPFSSPESAPPVVDDDDSNELEPPPLYADAGPVDDAGNDAADAGFDGGPSLSEEVDAGSPHASPDAGPTEPEELPDAGPAEPPDAGVPPLPLPDAGASDTGAPPDDRSQITSTGRPLPAGSPGGWQGSTFVFSQARLKADGNNNDWVEIGWYELDAGSTALVCGTRGPRVTRKHHHWAHGYGGGDCTRDIDSSGNLQRWDHSSVLVDGCPPASGFVDSSGRTSTRPFLNNCPAHITAGFGESAALVTTVGRYEYDAAARTLVFRFPDGQGCRSEYYRGLSIDAAGQLVSMGLDGVKTGNRQGAPRGLGGTHGYAYGSSAPLGRHVPLLDATAVVGTGNLVESRWHLREVPEPGEPPLSSKVGAIGFKPARCGQRSDVAYDHSCAAKSGYDAYLKECYPGKTAYLKFMVDPFPNRGSRENLFWGWHAYKDRNWTGCYHKGSHSYPLLQIIDAAGTFRGYVGVEIQKSGQGFTQTDYMVFRWITRGFEEQP